ncbi:MAG: DUF4169 family protein [Acetobacteraceae bacterium]|nr:DUF4169 family protein [Acetobacteraceae bacterium]
MTGEVVNLAKARKARDKAAAEREAAANRARHGRTRAQKARDAAGEEQRRKLLDQARREE